MATPIAVKEIQNLNREIKELNNRIQDDDFSSDLEKSLFERALKQKRDQADKLDMSEIPIDVGEICKALVNSTVEDALVLCIVQHPDFKKSFKKARDLGIDLEKISSSKNSVFAKEIEDSINNRDFDRARKIDEMFNLEPFMRKVLIKCKAKKHHFFIRSLERSLGWMCGDGNKNFDICCEVNGSDGNKMRNLIKTVARMPVQNIISAHSRFVNERLSSDTDESAAALAN